MNITDSIHGFLWQHPTINNCNSYLISGPSPILIDPGHRDLFDHVQTALTTLGLSVEALKLVICTHAHPDHMEGAGAIVKPSGPLFALHPLEWRMAREMARQLGVDFSEVLDAVEPSFFLEEGLLDVDGIGLRILHSPGHSPGSITLFHPETGAAFTGDLIFAEGVGRTDLPGGDGGRLKESILRLKDLPIRHLLPGHGPVVSGPAVIRRCFDRVESVWFQAI
jgi:glyoxylase-like metal-dependent hydrolase (beta-lactamase superfamily II)